MKGAWRKVARGVLTLSLAVALPDCVSDGEARLQGPREGTPLAQGAYERLRFGDACAGGGKLSFCGTDALVSVDELTSLDPEIARIVPAEQAPAGVGSATHYVLGVAPGFATLHFRGTFEDGSVRSDDLRVEVRKADRGVVVGTCNGVETSEVTTIPAGSASFQVKLFGRSVELAGFHPDAVLPVEGVAVSPGAGLPNVYTWSAPPEPTVLELRSGVVPGKLGTLRAYAPSEVSDVVVESVNGSSLVVFTTGRARIEATTKVRGAEPCDVHPVLFRSETPAICSGPEGADTWAGEDEFGGFAELHAEGVCRISASADGVRFFRPATLRIFLVTPPGDEKFDGFNQPCTVEGSTSCTYGENSQVTVCRDLRWTTKETCGPTRTCDARDPSLAGCVGGGPCSECRALR
jgi:hypothetical protein